MSEPDVVRALRTCCGVEEWARNVAARRPFRSLPDLLEAADEAWRRAGPAAWRAAFDYHPRIGERENSSGSDPAEFQAWSASEQSAAMSDATVARRALEEGQREYERKFGHIYLICATGRTATEMLDDIRRRLSNEPERELAVAAEEQRKITRLRLQKLLTNADPGSA